MENNASAMCYSLGRLQLVSILEACWPWSVVPELLVGNASFDVVFRLPRGLLLTVAFPLCEALPSVSPTTPDHPGVKEQLHIVEITRLIQHGDGAWQLIPSVISVWLEQAHIEDIVQCVCVCGITTLDGSASASCAVA
eukprot:365999-Chlamydomonas_euryale.AAC.3